LRACSTNAAAGALVPVAVARKSARCLSLSMKAMRGLAAAVRRTAACDCAPGAPTRPCVHLWLPCARGNRVGACVRACSVDRSASRSGSPLGAPWARRTMSSKRQVNPKSFGPAHDLRGL
jgi:hypothetical protein